MQSSMYSRNFPAQLIKKCDFTILLKTHFFKILVGSLFAMFSLLRHQSTKYEHTEPEINLKNFPITQTHASSSV